MKKVALSFVAAAALVGVGIVAAPHAHAAAISGVNTSGIYMYRLYNPNSGEHFYTASVAEEQNLVRVGWAYEGVGWIAPKSGAPVYRLYNPNSGEHFYTTSSFERDSLVKSGWKYEGISWYSGGKVPLYRAYNPHVTVGAHNYTTSSYEQSSLVKIGWRNEGIAWYGVGGGIGAAKGSNYVGFVKDGNQNIVGERLFTTLNEAMNWAKTWGAANITTANGYAEADQLN